MSSWRLDGQLLWVLSSAPGRDSNPHISSLTNPRPQPLNQVDQSSESSAMLFLKKSTLCSRRNPPHVVGEIPLLVNKLLQVSSRARYSTSDELWTRGRRETKQNLQLFSLRVNYSTLSLRGNEFAFSSFFATACLSCQPDRGIGGDIAGKRQLFAVIGSLITLRSRPLKQHRHCYLSSLDKGQKVLPSINPSARQLKTFQMFWLSIFLLLPGIHTSFTLQVFNQIKEGTSPIPSEPA